MFGEFKAEKDDSIYKIYKYNMTTRSMNFEIPLLKRTLLVDTKILIDIFDEVIKVSIQGGRTGPLFCQVSLVPPGSRTYEQDKFINTQLSPVNFGLSKA